MTEAGDHNRREVFARFVNRGLQARHIVIFEVHEMGAILAGDAGHARRAPGQRAVIASLRDQHLAPPGPGAGDRHAGGRGIATVLLEHRPVRMRHQGDEIFGQPHHDLAGAIEAVAE